MANKHFADRCVKITNFGYRHIEFVDEWSSACHILNRVDGIRFNLIERTSVRICIELLLGNQDRLKFFDFLFQLVASQLPRIVTRQ